MIPTKPAPLSREWSIEWSFRLSLLAKAALGAVQVLSGVFLWIAPSGAIRNVVDFLVRNELAEDPGDPLAHRIMDWAATINPSAENFYLVYLFGHGLLHFVVVTSLLMKWRSAYPISLGTLCAFVVYQGWKFVQAPDPALILLTAIDVAVIAIVILEHRQSQRLALGGGHPDGHS